jgi:hypothetical protein
LKTIGELMGRWGRVRPVLIMAAVKFRERICFFRNENQYN